MQTKEDKILTYLTSREHEIVDFARQLISTPSTNPPGDERAVAELVVAKTRELGLGDPEIVAKDHKRPNLILRVPEIASDGPSLLYNSHLDTKPVGVRSDWQTDPFDPVVKDGKLYGLGSTDMKSAVAAMVYAVAAISSLSEELRGQLILVLTADEEAGGAYGAEYLSQEYLLEADVGLVGEPSGIRTEWEYLDLISRGESCFIITIHGTQMHSSLSDLLPSVNACTRLAEVMLRLKKELEIDDPGHPLCEQGITVTPGVMMSGGTFYGMLPGQAQFGTEIRVVPGMTKEGIKADVESFVSLLRAEDPGLDIEWEFERPPLDWIEPLEVCDDEPFVRELLGAAKEVLGFSPRLGAFPAWTDARFFAGQAGIPTIPAFGPGLLSLAHCPNEWVSVESISKAAKIYALAAFSYLTNPK